MLVYLVGHPDKVAIAESMLIVGAIAIATVIPYAKAGETDWIRVLGFGLPASWERFSVNSPVIKSTAHFF